jgi:hypothetical protein
MAVIVQKSIDAGFNFTEIPDQISVQEQSSYNFCFVPIRTSEVVFSSGLGVGKQMSNAPSGYSYSTTKGATVQYQFRGRRIGVILNKKCKLWKTNV